jgi:hypothetical protein
VVPVAVIVGYYVLPNGMERAEAEGEAVELEFAIEKL